MDFTKGYTASFYGVELDPITKSEKNRFEIISGSINREESDLRHSANLTLKDNVDLNDTWVRIYMTAKQGSDSERVALFTGLASSPSVNFNNGHVESNVQCYSVLKAIADIILPIGWYAAAGYSGDQLYSLLEQIPFPVTVDDGAPNISDSIIAEYEETNLSMVDAILSAISTDENNGWKLQIAGDGSVNISPYAKDPVMTFSQSSSIIESSFSITHDWFNCPNVFRAGYGDYTAIARDDDIESELSTVSRGREIWMAEESADVMDNESIGDYAKRRLREEQSRSEKITYSRRFLPEVNQGDYVKLAYPEISGNYFVESQSITLGANATVNETIYKKIE